MQVVALPNFLLVPVQEFGQGFVRRRDLCEIAGHPWVVGDPGLAAMPENIHSQAAYCPKLHASEEREKQQPETEDTSRGFGDAFFSQPKPAGIKKRGQHEWKPRELTDGFGGNTQPGPFPGNAKWNRASRQNSDLQNRGSGKQPEQKTEAPR